MWGLKDPVRLIYDKIKDDFLILHADFHKIKIKKTSSFVRLVFFFITTV